MFYEEISFNYRIFFLFKNIANKPQMPKAIPPKIYKMFFDDCMGSSIFIP